MEPQANAIYHELEASAPEVHPPAIASQRKMRTPRAVPSYLALSGFLLLAVSVAATGYGASPGENGYAGGGHQDTQAGSNGYGGDGATAGSSGGGGGQEGSYTVPPYQKAVDGLDERFYEKSCPKMEEIVGKAVMKAVKADETLAASIIRLFFHDFAVGGVDGSVLIDVPGQSEKYAEASRTLRGFELIEEIKKELEAECHATVSCADLLTAAARDAAFSAGAPYWSLMYGRNDRKGYFSAETADRGFPMGGWSVTKLVAFFQDNGLNTQDLVALSGAHTIGRATCGAVRPGLYRRRKAGTLLDRQYGDFLQRKCGAGGDAEYVELDGETPTAFDNQYYTNLLHGKGVLDTDQELLDDSRTAGFVKSFAYQKSQEFANQFSKSMRRLGEAQVLTGNEGEVRRKCSAVNY